MEKIMNENFIQMNVTGLTVDPFTNMPIIILKDKDENLALPIWIGLIEASSIATELEKVKLTRPMTHDLMKNILEVVGAQVVRVDICDLSDNTFFARVFLLHNQKEIPLDCRPSDALALALRTQAPIFVSKQVIDKSRKIDFSIGSDPKNREQQKWTEILENLTPEDFGKYKM